MLRRLSFLLIALLTTLVVALSGPSLASAAGAQTPGVQLHLLWGGVSTAEMDRQLDEAKAAGAGLVRVDLGWQTLEEQGKGRWSGWYLTAIDNVVAKAEARGIKVLFTVLETPCWASSAPETLKQGCAGSWWERGVNRYPPSNVQDYADAVRFLASRYAGRVAAWEVWNEPNLDGFWKTSDPAGDYVRLVKAAYPAIKGADPSARVVAGVLSEADVPFAEELYARGIKGWFDTFSIHPYSHDFSPTKVLSGADVRSSFISGVPAIRKVMVANGDPKPMWLTEFGWSTSTVRNSEPWYNGVDESVQAQYLRDAYSTMRSWDYVETGVWFNLVNWSTNTVQRDANFGLLRRDHSEKPAYSAYRAAAADLAGGTIAAAPVETAPTTTTTTPPAPCGCTAKPGKGGTSGPKAKTVFAAATGPSAVTAAVTKKASPRRKKTTTTKKPLRATIVCTRRRVLIKGTAPKGSLVKVQAFRRTTLRLKKNAKPSFRKVVRAKRNGRFAVAASKRLRGCRYVAKASRVSAKRAGSVKAVKRA